MSNIPCASEIPMNIEMADASPTITVEEIVAAIATLDATDLMRVMKAHTVAWEKLMKTVSKVAKAATSKKVGSMPKGVVPPQLRRPRAWVEFVLAHAHQNGWEAFTITQSKKDKATGEKVTELIEMAASEMYEGQHVYEGSVSEKNPNGKQMIHKEAMSLSKQYWAPKEQMGSHQELYETFLASYVEEDVEMNEAAVAAEPKVVRKTAAELEALKEEKEALKEAQKAAKEAAKEAAKALKEQEKAEAKEAAKALKEQEKAAKEAEKAAAKAAKKPTTPVKAVVKAAPTASAAPAATPVKAAAKTVVKAAPAAPIKAKKEWTCEDDGQMHPWAHKGKLYLRNFENNVWAQSEDGDCAEWCGIYLPKEDRFDDSVEEPNFDDDEE